MEDNTYTIKAISKLSGVSELLIRAWESRYKALEPARTSTKRRLYSEKDLEKLVLLSKLTENGHRIGAIAALETDELKKILSRTEISKLRENLNIVENSLSSGLIGDCLGKIREYDAKGLERILFEASVQLSQQNLLMELILPLMEKIGELWHEGILRVSHEHFTSAIIRKFLINLSEGYNIKENAPKIVITTPQGQYHEIGALVGAAYAASEGWKIIYLGPSLPAEEIIHTVRETGAKMIYMSLVYPFVDPSLGTEMSKLSDGVLNGVKILVAGNAVTSYRRIFEDIGAFIINDFEEFKYILRNNGF